jgi:cardiolipin synthase A/B
MWPAFIHWPPDMIDFLREMWLHIAGALTIIAALLASGHAVLQKRDNRAAAGWVAVVWLAPIAGPILYLLLGINRIRRRGTELRRERLQLRATTEELQYETQHLREVVPERGQHLLGLGNLVDRVTRTPLAPGNAVDPLLMGDVAYPAMIEAIDAAEDSIALCTYIFDNDTAGRMFADALERAVRRGLQVRVLIDSVGARYSWPPIVRGLEKRGVNVARFLHSSLPWRMPYINLRTHRKILVVDGQIGFTGGMNIRSGHLLKLNRRSPVQDIHFRIKGPVVRQMMHVFAEDWAFTTKEMLDGDLWFPPIEPQGSVVARGIPDGPDRDLGHLPLTLLGALARSQYSVKIVTPYFLPDTALITSLNVASMRGVEIDIVLPETNNLLLVKWAMNAQLWQVLTQECRVHLSEPPFDHSKLMIVDGTWSLIGSANWDPRSLRLNFEYNVECYDERLAATLSEIVDEKIRRSRRVTLEQMDARSFPVRLRDGFVRLFTPYL